MNGVIMSDTYKYDTKKNKYRSHTKMRPYKTSRDIEYQRKSSIGKTIKNGLYKPSTQTTNNKKKRLRQIDKGQKRMSLKEELRNEYEQATTTA
jgi:hypothetical protein